MTEEMIDVFDENMNKIGQESKKEAHKKGLWHQSAHIWIFNSKGEVLVQKRSKNKDSWPGLWDISAAGHVSAGETPEKAAPRELFEELGLKIDASEFKKLKLENTL